MLFVEDYLFLFPVAAVYAAPAFRLRYLVLEAHPISLYPGPAMLRDFFVDDC